MFSISQLSLNLKKNSEILLSDFQCGLNYSMLCLYESSPSSDTGCLIFIQQNDANGSIKVKRLVWVSDSAISALTINPCCDWLALALRGGNVCVLPLGAVMNRVQKKCDHWKANDVTYLPNKLKNKCAITCMKWWNSYKDKNLCLLGSTDGDVRIMDLYNGSVLYSEKFPDHIVSIDLLISADRTLAYCLVTTKVLNQWKLLLEEYNSRESFMDLELGFEALEFSNIHSSNIINSKFSKSSKKEKVTNTSYLPSKLYQFPQSTFLKSQYYNKKCFLGAYDSVSGKYKLFDISNLEEPLFDFQLPFGVLDICVTEDLLFLLIGSRDNLNSSSSKLASEIQRKSLKFCIVLRQYAYSSLYENQRTKHKKGEKLTFKPSLSTVVPKTLAKSLLFEFEISGLRVTDEVINISSFPHFFNFNYFNNAYRTDNESFSLTNLKEDILPSKWSVAEMKLISPLIIVGTSGAFVCHLSHCFEDKFIDHLLSGDIKKAEWIGAGLKLDMNYLYQFTAQLIAHGKADLSSTIAKSKSAIILEYFDMGSTPMSSIFACIIKVWPPEACLQYALSQLSKINQMSPIDRNFLSNALIALFGHVMSDPLESVSDSPKNRQRYYEKFKRFVINNCFFTDVKAAKTMIHFGLLEEAFFIAKEKGCILEVFTYLSESNYLTGWSNSYPTSELRTKYSQMDQDIVFNAFGQMELEIVTRSDHKHIRILSEYVCSWCLNKFSSNVNPFSFKTTTHLCNIFNPFGPIIETLFRILSCATAIDSAVNMRREKDMSALFSSSNTRFMDSINDASLFSENLKIRRDVGPSLLAYCLLVISRDNQINDFVDFLYFIDMYSAIHGSETGVEQEIIEEFSREDGDKRGKFRSLLNLIANNGNIKPKKQTLSNFWKFYTPQQLLSVRNDLCLSVSVYDSDLFDEDDYNIISKLKRMSIRINQDSLVQNFSKFSSDKPCKKSQINLRGFQREKVTRVLLLPKPIEIGKEIVKQISLGINHALILTDSGIIYGAGSNQYGQLGVEQILINPDRKKTNKRSLNVIIPVPVTLDIPNGFILSICAGGYHSGAVIISGMGADETSYALTWGWGVHGQLGHGDNDDQRFPKRLEWNLEWSSEQFPVQMSMGIYHSVLLTNKGNVYCFGNNGFGQLGKSGLQKSVHPVHVDQLPESIILVDTKYYHTVCCTSNEIFYWGIHPNLWQNAQNQMKSHHDICIPQKVTSENLLDNEKICQISCGANHTTLLTENNLVFSFGANMAGQLGVGVRKEINKLVEVTIPKPIQYLCSDDGITVAMSVTEKCTKLFVWGRYSHPLILDDMKNIITDTLKPQLLAEYQHSSSVNFIDQNCYGVETIHSGCSSILNKEQLMIFFLNFSKYINRQHLLHALSEMMEYDIISDYFLANDMFVESLYWRCRSVDNRLQNDRTGEKSYLIRNDIEAIFCFYLRLAEKGKNPSNFRSLLTIVTGFFKTHGLPWEIYEKIVQPYLAKHAIVISLLLLKYSLKKCLSSVFIRDLSLQMMKENVDGLKNPVDVQPIDLTAKHFDRFYDLIKAGNPETVYDSADDYKVVFFAKCGHSSVVSRFREHQLKSFVEKFRKKQLTLSSQLIQRLYSDSSVWPDCLDCLLHKL